MNEASPPPSAATPPAATTAAALAFRSVNIAKEVIIDGSWKDETLWVPITDQVSIRPFLFDVSGGSWSSLLRVAPGGRLACHYHTGPVYGYVVEGSWRYLEHDWVAKTGTFIFEPPGEMHTLVADPEAGMITFFVTRGALIYTDKSGRQVGYEDVFTRLAHTQKFWKKSGLDKAQLQAMIR
ncbi:MAG: 2,4'-dihydroxyacetophenone dioxygenase family protein [Dongiaceae bacterium]